MSTTKQPLHPNGGTPVVDADMPLDELQTVYQPDDLLSEGGTAIDQGPNPAIAQNGDETAPD